MRNISRRGAVHSSRTRFRTKAQNCWAATKKKDMLEELYIETVCVCECACESCTFGNKVVINDKCQQNGKWKATVALLRCSY